MKPLYYVLFSITLSGCAEFDSQRFANALYITAQQQAAIDQYGVDALNANAARMAANMRASQDFDWDWDEFYVDGRRVWACRGINTGQFAPEDKCLLKLKTDFRWPSKQAW